MEDKSDSLTVKLPCGDFLSSEIQKNTGLVFDTEENKFVSTPDSSVYKPTDLSKVNNFYQRWQTLFDEGKMTSNQFLNMRKELADLSKYEGIGKSSESVTL